MTGVERGDIDRGGGGVVPAERFLGHEEIPDHPPYAVFEELAQLVPVRGKGVVANWARSSRHR